MIVGNGMIAKALKNKTNVIFHARGVSNSQCVEEDEYTRDMDALAFSLKSPGLLVYFSTTSEAPSRYVQHKREAEELVMARGNYLICRLPIVAGTSSNPHTLLNWLKAKIIGNQPIPCWVKARRNIIDVQDVSALVSWLLETGAKDETVNLAAPVDYPMLTIVKTMASTLGKEPHINTLYTGDAQTIDTTRIKDAPLRWPDLKETLVRYYA